MSSGNEGYKNWRQLQKENAEPFSNSLSSTLSTLRNNLYRYPSITDPEYSYSGPIYRPEYENKTKYGDSSLGTSTYDPEYLNVEESGNWQDLRAQNQPWYSKAFNGIMKGGVLTGTTFVSGIAGLLYGGVEAIAKGDFSKLWDNDVTQAMNDINQYSEYYLPNYYTKEEQESPWYTNIVSANFVFDKFVKNLGFTVGAALSGGVYTKGISYAAKAIGALKGLGVGAEALGAESRLGGMTKGLKALWAGDSAGQSYEVASKLAQQGMKAMEISKGTRATKALVGTFFNAVAEGTVEAVHNSTNWADAKYTELDQLAQQESMEAAFEYENNKQSDSPMDPAFIQYIEKLSDIEKRHEAAKQQVEIDRKRFGTMDLAMNIPILWAGDWMTFGKFYAGGWKAARNVARTQTRATKEALKDARQAMKNGDKEAMSRLQEVVARAEATGYQGLTAEEKLLVQEVSKRNLIQKVWPYLKEPLKEGNEEMAQAAAELTSGYYYNKDIDRIFAAENDPESISEVLDFVSSLGQGIKDSYGDINRWEEGFIGALTGFLGVPTFGRVANSTDQTWLGNSKPIGITGGVVTAVKNAWNDRDNVKGAVQHVNEVLHNPDRIANFKHLIAQTRLNKDGEISASQDDEMSYKDSKTAGLFEDVMYFKKVGRLDLLKRAIENTELLSEEDINKIVEDTVSYIDSQGKAVNTRAHIDEAKKNLEKIKATVERAISLMDEAKKPEAERSPDFDPSKVPTEAELDTLRQNYAEAEAAYQAAEQSASKINSTMFSPYMRNGQMMTAEEIKEDITKRAAQVWQMIEDISQIQDEIDNSSGEVYGDSELATLTWYKAMSRDWERRASSLGFSLKDFIKAGVQQKDEVYSTIKDIQKQLEKLKKENDEEGKNDVLISVYDNLLNQLAPYNYGTAALNLFKQIDDIIEGISIAEAHNFSNVVERRKLSKEERKQAREEEIENAKRRQFGVKLATLLSSDQKVTVPVKKADSNTGETENVEMTTGEFLMTHIKGAIVTAIEDPDIQAITLKNLQDLKRIGQAYKEYQDKIIEFRKNPRAVEDKKRGIFDKIKEVTDKFTGNARAQLLKRKLNFKEGEGMLLKSLRSALPSIQNFGGLNKLKAIKGLFTKEEIEMLDKVAKSDKIINSTIQKLNDIDISGLEELPEATLKAMNDLLEKYPNLGPDNLNDLYDQATEKAIKDFDMQELDVDLEALKAMMKQKYDDAVSEVIDAFIKADLDDREETNIPTDPGLDDSPVPENIVNASRVISDEEWEGTPEDDQALPVDRALLSQNGSRAKSITQVEDKEHRQASSSTSDIKIDQMKQAAKSRTDSSLFNDKDPHQALSEFLLGGFVDVTLAKLYQDHPELIPDDIQDKEGFKKYVNAVWEYLYGSQSGNFASQNVKKMSPNETLVFSINQELSNKAGVNVVIITRQSTGEVVGSLMSQYEIDAYETFKARGNKANPAIEDSLLIYRQLQADPNTPQTRTVKQVFSGDLSRSPQELTIAQAMNNGSNKELTIGVVKPSDLGTPTIYYYQYDSNTKQMEQKSMQIPNAELGQVYWLVKGPGGMVPVLTYSIPLSSVIGTEDFVKWAEIALFGEDGHFNNPGQGKLFKFLYLPSTYVQYTKVDENTKKYRATIKDSATHISVRMLDLRDPENPVTTFRLIKLNASDGRKTDRAITLEVLKALTSSYQELYGKDELKGLTMSVDAERLRDTNTKVNNMTYAEFISHTLKSNVNSSDTVNDRFSWNIQVAPNPMDNSTKKATATQKSVTVRGTTYTYYISTQTGQPVIMQEIEGKKAMVFATNPQYDDILEAIEKQQQVQGEDNIPQSPVTPKTQAPPRIRTTGTSDLNNYTKDKELSENTLEGEAEEIQAEETFYDEMEVISEMFPHLNEADRVTIVGNLRSMSKQGMGGDKIYGKFKNGMILIAKTTIKGSLYHESFHYVMDALFTETERKAVFEAIQQLYPDLISENFANQEEYEMALEEKAAEKFRMFMLGQRDKTFRGRLLRLFRKLKFLIQELFGSTNYLDNMFYRMYSGQLASRPEYTKQDADYYSRKLNEYYNEKYSYDNLPLEDIEYMVQRGLSRDEYELLSVNEKEVLFKCM